MILSACPADRLIVTVSGVIVWHRHLIRWNVGVDLSFLDSRIKFTGDWMKNIRALLKS